MIIDGEHVPMRFNQTETRAFMNKQDTLRILYNDTTIKDYNDLLENITQDYNDLVDLRNRVKEGIGNDTTLFEEDHITLDHILDYMEIFMKLIGMGENDNDK